MRIFAGRCRAVFLQIGTSGTLGVALGALALGTVMTPSSATAQSPTALTLHVQADLVQQTGGEIYTFYAGRSYRPLWFDGEGALDPAAKSLLELLDGADYDGISSADFNLIAIRSAIEAASESRSPASMSRADLLLSGVFVAYVNALRAAVGSPLIYEHSNLRPRPVQIYQLLNEAAHSPSLNDYIVQMRWMHPLYAPLRQSLRSAGSIDDHLRQVTISSLTRIRGIPNSRRQVIVDVASARLWMYEDGRPVDSMRVVVGKPTTRTPLLAGYIRYAITNPYWNVPPEMVSKNVASNVLSRGVGYLKAGGYEVLSDWGEAPTLVDPRTINWRAAEKGTLDLRVRQLPVAGNFMGRVKFEFPNPEGIYLHDTPQKDLMLRVSRQLSGGCIRLEDANRLGRWLMRGELPMQSDKPEVKVNLLDPIPIYITYITAQIIDNRISLGPDPYGLDVARSALSGGLTKRESR